MTVAEAKEWYYFALKHPVVFMAFAIVVTVWPLIFQWLFSSLRNLLGRQPQAKSESHPLKRTILFLLYLITAWVCFYYVAYPIWIAKSLTYEQSIMVAQGQISSRPENTPFPFDGKEWKYIQSHPSTLPDSFKNSLLMSEALRIHNSLVEKGIIRDTPKDTWSKDITIVNANTEPVMAASLVSYNNRLTSFGKIVAFWKINVLTYLSEPKHE